jgi:hypothetical protein
MAKTDFTKVEEALNAGLRKMEVNRLLDIADEVQGKKKEGESELPVAPEQRQLLTVLRSGIKYLRKLEKDPFEKSTFQKEEIIELLQNPDKLNKEQWEKLEAFRKHVSAFKASLEKGDGEKKDENLVEQERKDQKQRRFNVNDKWLPLS